MREYARGSAVGSAMGWGSAALDRRNRGVAAFALALLAFLGIGASSAAAAAPTVTIDPASLVGVTSAKVSGEVDPGGKATSYHFEYVTDAQYDENETNGVPLFEGASQAGNAELAEGEPATAVGAVLELQPATEYHLRLIAANEDGEATPAVAPTFVTDSVTIPTLATQPVTAVGYSGATLHGTIDPEGGNENPAAPPGEELMPIEWQLQYREVVPGQGEEDGWASLGGTTISGAEAGANSPIALETVLPPGQIGSGKDWEARLFAYYAIPRYEVAKSAEPFEAFSTLAATAPLLSIDDASSITGTSAHFSGTVTAGNADPAFDSPCRFDYLTDAQYQANLGNSLDGFEGAAQAPCDVNPVTGAGDTPVAADVTGLQPHTTYHLRLFAENQAGPATDLAPDFLTEAIAPAILSTTVSDVTTDSASLHAQVNPGGAPTTYHFEYLTLAAFEGAGETFAGALSTPESTSIGADNQVHPAAADLSGLAPDTAYRYRVVATNEKSAPGGTPGPVRAMHTLAVAVAEPDTCANATRRAEQHSAYLPDCRAYEQVSPVDKNGSDVLLDQARTRAAAGGDAVQFASLGAFGHLQGASITTDYIATRGPAAWSTNGITPKKEPVNGPVLGSGFADEGYQGEFSADLSRGVVLANGAPATNPNVTTVRNLFVAENLLTDNPTFKLATDSVAPLPPAFSGPDAPDYLYAPYFAGASADFGHVLFESTLNLTQQAIDAGLPIGPVGAGTSKLYESDHGSVRLVGILPASEGGGPAPTAVAGQGASGASAANTPGVISADGSRIFFTVRGPSTSAGQLYMRENASTTVRLNPTPEPDTYWDASADGSKVFFTTPGQVYRYDADAPPGDQYTALLQDEEPADGGANAEGVIGVSRDGDRAFLVATGGQLAAGAPLPSGSPPLIYAWHAGTGLAYVGQLNSAADLPDDLGTSGWLFFPKTSRVSPDGMHLLFTSRVPGQAPGDDNTACTGSFGHPCQSLFVYSAAANGGPGELLCASCDPTGAPVTVDAAPRVLFGTGAAATASHLGRAISDDGRYAFFSTAARLLEADSNGKVDAYVYDTEAEQVHLLSSGTSPADSFFMDASASGKDAFFATRQQLLGWDNDGAYDLYDARVEGGFPEPTPVPAPCAGDGCRGPAAGPTAAQSPASSSLIGPGDRKPPPRCAKGKVRRHGKCVKRGHHKRRANHHRRASR